ncbi:unnamed protein product [Rhodiola kirilowii]
MDTEAGKVIMLFGVRIVVDSMRKTASLNNLSDYQHVADAGKAGENENMAAKPDGYVSDNVVRVRGVRERKRGTPWSEEEHKRFLMGLQKVGKGDWRGISKNFVKTRNPTQVASHAQKYFLRHNTVKRRRRHSLFDITTETVSGKPMQEKLESTHVDSAASQPHSPTTNSSNTGVYPMVPALRLPIQMSPLLLVPIYPSESFIHPPPPPPLALQSISPLNSNSLVNYTPPLSLNLSLSLPSHSQASPNPALQTMSGLMGKDSYISVA